MVLKQKMIIVRWIRSFIDESNAGIKISPQEQVYAGVNDRIVTLTGSLEEQMCAIELILSKLIEDSHYSHTVHTPYPYSGRIFTTPFNVFNFCVPMRST